MCSSLCVLYSACIAVGCKNVFQLHSLQNRSLVIIQNKIVHHIDIDGIDFIKFTINTHSQTQAPTRARPSTRTRTHTRNYRERAFVTFTFKTSML